jgi:NitT/TauT family transport system ATP-binding protein
MRLLAQNLSFTYPGKHPQLAVNGLSFTVPTGQFAAVIGPSGCGKSTLLRLAAGLLRATSGILTLDGAEPEVAAGQHRLAWMAQSPALLPWLNAEQNIALAQRFHPASSLPHLNPQDSLARVGLADAARSYPHQLSGGMQQRVALARTLSLEAGLWLMDEPFAALDELTRERLAQELLELWRPLSPTVLWVTHNIHEALRLADRVLVLSPRPAQLALDLNVDLPYPRREGDPAFQRTLAQLRAVLGLGQPEAV